MKKIFFALLIFISTNAFSQFTLINKEYSPQDIVTKILLDSTENFKPQNIEYTGSPLALGVFECKMEYNKDFIKRGIILSTGFAADAKGPNTDGTKTGVTSMNFDSDLQALVKDKNYDAASLSFDFTATGDSLSFNYIFASEEYPEYIGQGKNDVFGFFVADLNDKKINYSNIAFLPDGFTPITVDNVNHIRNPEYYLPNYSANDPMLDWRTNPKVAELAYAFQYDGMTKMLHAKMQTIPGHKYHIKIAIGDVGDNKWDSAIMLEAHSFKTKPPVSENSLALVKTLFDVKDKNADSVVVSVIIHFDVDSSVIKTKEDFAQLDKIVSLLQNSKKLKVAVNGHTDNDGTAQHNLVLSQERAKSVADYLKSKGVDASRISHQGFGATKPVSTDKAKNRRVDFIFR